jgi:hypothetical protein
MCRLPDIQTDVVGLWARVSGKTIKGIFDIFNALSLMLTNAWRFAHLWRDPDP